MLFKRGALALGLLVLGASATANAAVVISQVYGGGGNAGSTYKNDFIEIFNAGSTAQSLNGWSVQYAAVTGTSWQVTNLGNVTLQPGQYFLVQEAAGGAGTTNLPTPDATGTINMSGTQFKVALVSSTTALTGGCPTTNVLDLIGVNSSGTNSCFEGTTTAALTNTTSAQRNGSGCTDTNNNLADFTAGAAAPRNTATTTSVCGGPTPITLSIADVTQAEGDSGTSTFHFVVTLSGAAPAGGVTFDIATADGTATTTDNDYVAKALTSQTIATGGTTYGFDVTVNGDTKLEGNEAFHVNVTNVAGTATTVADGSADGTLTNDDTTPTVSINDVTQAEGHTGTTNFVFTVTASAPAPAGGISVTAATTGSSATAGTDYVETSGTVSIPENATSATYTVAVNGDTDVESDETFNVDLSVPTGATIADGHGVGTILNDDAVVPQITIGDVAHAEGDSGTTAFVFTVSSNVPAPAGGIDVTYATADGSASTSDNDYTAASGTATIPAGAASTTVTVLVTGDRKSEASETFFVNLGSATNGAAIADNQATGTIANDDQYPVISVANAHVGEGDSGTKTLDFTVQLSAPALEGGVHYGLSTSDGTATAGSDYDALATNGAIAAGDSSATVSVTIHGDTAYEPNETFALHLTNIGGAVLSAGRGERPDGSVGPNLDATGTIDNDDTAPQLSIADASVAEGNAGQATLAFTVSLDVDAPAGGVTFNYATTDGSATTADADYAAVTNGSGSIAAGSRTTTVNVLVNGDAKSELDETLTVTLSNPTNAQIAAASATGRILNDDVLTIGAIQGTGVRSTYAPASGQGNGQTVATRGNVVTALGPAGFFMQSPDAPSPNNDNDPATSDGVYVFTSTAPTVAIGDVVDVTAPVAEYFDFTQLVASSAANSTIAKTGTAPLPTPVELDANRPSTNPAAPSCPSATFPTNWECYEGMRMHIGNGLVTRANLRRANPNYAESFVTATGKRSMREPNYLYGQVPPSPAAGAAVWDGNPEVFELDTNTLLPVLGPNPADNALTAGTTFTATGVIGYDFGDYEFWPTAMQVTQANVLPRPVPASHGAAELRIGDFNAERFCDEFVDPTKQFTCSGGATEPTATQVTAKVTRVADYIVGVLDLPDVIGLQEIENQDMLNRLVAEIKLQTGNAAVYTSHIVEGNDPSGIDVAYLVRDGRFSNVSVQAFDADLDWTYNATTERLFDHPPLLLRATFTGGGNSFPVALLNNHLKARTKVDSLTDAAAPRDRQKRFEQAQALAHVVQDFQSNAANAGVALAVMGDLNAFEFSDGYADLVGLISGDYDNALNQIQLAGPNIVNPPLLKTALTIPRDDRYSYTFTEKLGAILGYESASASDTGRDVPTIQVIDHVLLDRNAQKYFVEIRDGRANGDVPDQWITACKAVTSFPDPTCPDPAVGSSDHEGSVTRLATDRIFANGFVGSGPDVTP